MEYKFKRLKLTQEALGFRSFSTANITATDQTGFGKQERENMRFKICFSNKIARFAKRDG